MKKKNEKRNCHGNTFWYKIAKAGIYKSRKIEVHKCAKMNFKNI